MDKKNMPTIKDYWINDDLPDDNEQVLIKVERASGEFDVVQGYFTKEDADIFGNGVWFETPKFAKDDAVFPIDFMTQDNVVIGWLPLDIF